MTQQRTVPRDGSEYSAVLVREEFRNELDRLFPTKNGRRTLDDIRFQMLRYHSNRCVFDLSMNSADGWHSLIVKLFATDRRDAFEAMQKIHQNGFGSEHKFAVPKPIAYLPTLHVLLEEKVEGKQVKSILLSDNESEQHEAVERCGSWLAKFHTSAPKFGNRVDPRALLDHVGSWADMVSQFGKPFEAKCELLMRKLEAALPPNGTFEQCPGHGSFIPSHVLLGERRTVTIDFDEFELVDPARDLAWFLIALERYELKYHQPPGFFKRLAGPFVESYLEHGNKEALRHLTFYKGAEYLHRARHDLYKRTPPVPEWAHLMLDEAIAGL